MPRITKQEILKRVRAAMMPPIQPKARQKIGGASFDSLIQKAQQMTGAKPGLKISPEQRADMRARALPTRREEAERW